MPDLVARRLIDDIEAVRDQIAAIRGQVEELDERARSAHLANGGALDAAAGGLTCVVAMLFTSQQEIRHG